MDSSKGNSVYTSGETAVATTTTVWRRQGGPRFPNCAADSFFQREAGSLFLLLQINPLNINMY